MLGEFYIRFLSMTLLLHVSHGQEHQGAIEVHHISAGHFFQLKCSDYDDAEDQTTVTWSRGGNQTLNMTSGVEVRGEVLWFLPTHTSHNGHYTCESKYPNGSWEMKFVLSVDPGPCPVPAENRTVSQGMSEVVFCRQQDVLGLDPTAHIRWFKDCSPVDKHGETIIEEDGPKRLRLVNATESHAGVYTCLVEFSLQGGNYTATHSTQLKVNKEKVPLKPQVTYPRKETVTVEPGSRVELVCSAFLGVGEGTESESFMFWTVDGRHTDHIEQLNVTKTTILPRSSGVYGRSTLSIYEVRPEFLNVTISCIALNALGQDVGFLWLQPAMCCLFKVDLVLAYRRLRPLVSKKRAPDGKLYDAYVSYVHGDGLSRAEMFALQVLPEVLERRYGYTLFVSGRDDLPGEAIHDVTSETMRRSRRLIIILSAQSVSPLHPKMDPEDQLPLHQSPQDSPSYDQQIGLYDALIQNGLRVVLVEIDGKVDYTSLPKSLHYIRRKQGALRWRRPSSGKSSSTAHPNGHFWKCLRYHMPFKPKGDLKPQLTPGINCSIELY
ncbi:interleukin-1 receptor-like protein isoform X1 [Salmo salar]|uniref:Interleukin-1 receptor-like protein isoform X1 n=1 Tax=Salmo salar TaxID=8030 RepID=A0ABM3DWH1_SALSA|nr:interleukin-1 receptor-like protein isoform X1 [Salmo salar]